MGPARGSEMDKLYCQELVKMREHLRSEGWIYPIPENRSYSIAKDEINSILVKQADADKLQYKSKLEQLVSVMREIGVSVDIDMGPINLHDISDSNDVYEVARLNLGEIEFGLNSFKTN